MLVPQVVTINGAQVLHESSDLAIPQGIAHAVDRVMFPLPVGDLVQTMTADKDRRFATFLRAVRASGLSDMLTGEDLLRGCPSYHPHKVQHPLLLRRVVWLFIKNKLSGAN